MSIFQPHFFVGTYWGPRQENAQKCARRLKELLRRIADIDIGLRDWNVVQSNWRKKPHRLGTSQEALEELVVKEWMRKEIGGELVEDGGSNFMLSSGSAGGDTTTLGIGCGAWSEWLNNRCMIDLPPAGETTNRILRVSALIELMKASVEAWEPDRGVVTCSDLNEVVEPEAQQRNVGWLTYFSAAAYEPPEKIVSPSYVVPASELGYIIVAMDEKPQPNNADHIRILQKILKRIRRKPVAK